MSRLATWRRGPNDPTTLGGWLLSGGSAPSPPRLLDTRLSRKERIRSIGLVAGILVYVAVAFHFGPGIGPLLCAPLSLIEVVRYFRKKPSAVVSEGPDAAVWVVLTIFDRWGRSTGTDGGWLIHCDGWLLFEGARTSFAISRGEAQKLRHDNEHRVRLEDRREVDFAIPGDKPDWAPLERTFAEWNAAPIPEGEAVLPPATLHPEIGIGEWNVRLILWLGLLVAGGLLVYFEAPMFAAMAFSASFVCGIAAAQGAFRLRRDLQLSGLIPKAIPAENRDSDPSPQATPSEPLSS